MNVMHKKLNDLILVPGLVLFANSVVASSVPTISDIDSQIAQPAVEHEQMPRLNIGADESYPPAIDSTEDEESVFVKSVKIVGAVNIAEQELEAKIASFANAYLTFSELQNIVSMVTKEYRNKGYFVAKAYIPIQDLHSNNGVFVIRVVEGHYGDFELENNANIGGQIAQSILENTKAEYSVVAKHSLERAVLLINDIPGISVSDAQVMPGSDVGVSDFKIVTKPANKVDGYVLANNAGGKYSGTNRLMAGVNLNSPFDIGDKASFSTLIAESGALKNGKLSYSALLRPNGLSGEVSFAQTDYSLIEEYQYLDAVGSSKELAGVLKYPIIRTRNENLYGSVHLSYKRLNDEIRSTGGQTKKSIQSVKFSLDHDDVSTFKGKPANSSTNVRLTVGDLAFDNEADETLDESGAKTNGLYYKVNLDLLRSVAITPKLALGASLKMQRVFDRKNLDGSEDLSLGGENGVKLYPSGEFSAENGYLFNVEAKYQLPSYFGVSNSVGLFYDMGRAFSANNLVSFESERLQDVGVGYYTSYKKFFAQVQVAWKVDGRSVTSEQDRDSKVLFKAGSSF